MPRPKLNRRIAAPPLMMGYKPFGIPRKVLSELYLHFDEFEAIRLLDYLGMTQAEAADKMNVSRPTLTRIYEKARRTIARAFVEGKMIMIEGGQVAFEGEWYRCKRCHRLIKGRENHVPCKDCDSYSDEELYRVNEP
ncbi:MAG: DUF134 domain-containing protein [Bacteroidales bacterium]|jgi:predicted DNA-binding protein (UPF0251 family)|nr:DUF134 domain-containing protein [Bacteroidales bacterium]OQC03620.1 MAG: hypothetical protein BWX77_00583 [Bacteroidetes bacterium ADurb.Bin090]MBP8981410.1 DUF134 domain-containing protein [Bacteroidales bacterium]NLV39307.1 DUF134 domain-containing protein [Bacteroidales bacterium]HNZ80347.1 DUF134 domain-containing protein [Bacteroidales bacterium]